MKLLRMSCLNCHQKLAPNHMDRALACPHCQSHMTLDNRGLILIDVQYAQSNGGYRGVKSWEPVWVFEGKVDMSNRKSQKGGRRANMAAENLWGKRRHIFVPAGNIDADMLRQEGMRLTENQPPLTPLNPSEGPADRLVNPSILSAEDAQELIEFLILGLEAKRPDVLRTISFSYQVDPPRLWAFPFGGNRFLI